MMLFGTVGLGALGLDVVTVEDDIELDLEGLLSEVPTQ